MQFQCEALTVLRNRFGNRPYAKGLCEFRCPAYGPVGPANLTPGKKSVTSDPHRQQTVPFGYLDAQPVMMDDESARSA